MKGPRAVPPESTLDLGLTISRTVNFRVWKEPQPEPASPLASAWLHQQGALGSQGVSSPFVGAHPSKMGRLGRTIFHAPVPVIETSKPSLPRCRARESGFQDLSNGFKHGGSCLKAILASGPQGWWQGHSKDTRKGKKCHPHQDKVESERAERLQHSLTCIIGRTGQQLSTDRAQVAALRLLVTCSNSGQAGAALNQVRLQVLNQIGFLISAPPTSPRKATCQDQPGPSFLASGISPASAIPVS